MAPTRVFTALLVPAGLTLGHLVAYAIGASPSGEATATRGISLRDMVCLALPFTAVVLARALQAGLRTEASPVRFSVLAVLQVLTFVGVETVEHTATSGSTTGALRESVMLVGIAAQVFGAWLLVRVVHAVRGVGERLATPERNRVHANDGRRSERPPLFRVPVQRVAGSPCLRRGPPISF